MPPPGYMYKRLKVFLRSPDDTIVRKDHGHAGEQFMGWRGSSMDTNEDTAAIQVKKERDCSQEAKSSSNQTAMQLLLGDLIEIDSDDEQQSPFRAEATARRLQDTLEWWGENEKRYPNLSPLARKYLAIPATSAPSERAFSAAVTHARSKTTRLYYKLYSARMLNSGKWAHHEASYTGCGITDSKGLVLLLHHVLLCHKTCTSNISLSLPFLFD